MDKDDLKIILLLMINARLTYREIADQLGLSVNAVYKRINTLVNLGIIQRFSARIKSYAINAIYVFIFGESKIKDPDQLLDVLGEHQNTTHLMFSSRDYLYVGAFLKEIHDLDDYSSFIAQTANMNSPTVGFLSGVLSSSPIPYVAPTEVPVNYSNLDKSIIRSIHKDARKPISEIAEEVRSTPNTVTRRLNNMYESGLLELTIDFYPAASNDVFTVFQIDLEAAENREKFAQKIMDKFNPHIFFTWSFSNLPNFLLCWVWCNNMKQLNDIVSNLRKENIKSVSTDIVHKAAFFDTWKEELLYE